MYQLFFREYNKIHPLVVFQMVLKVLSVNLQMKTEQFIWKKTLIYQIRLEREMSILGKGGTSIILI